MCTVSGAMCGRRPGDQLVRDSDLFTETLDRCYDLQYVFDLFHLCQLSAPGDVVSINLSDDVDRQRTVPPLRRRLGRLTWVASEYGNG